MVDLHLPLRPGTDIAFLGGVVSYIVENGREFREYITHFSNAPVIIKGEFRDTEDLDGLFSGWDPDHGLYSPSSWVYEGVESELEPGTASRPPRSGEQAHGAHGMDLDEESPPEMDMTLEHPRCVYQLLKKHYTRYTPELVEKTCGVPKDQSLRVAEALCENSGRERTSAICYSVGWTQHTHLVQNVRAAAIVQTLLENIGRPGGGILALRGHANIQGSPDIPTLHNILPAYVR